MHLLIFAFSIGNYLNVFNMMVIKSNVLVRFWVLICLLLGLVNANGQTITTYAGLGVLTNASGDGGPATAANLTPWNMAKDAAGNIYFTDQMANIIRKINTSGTITLVGGDNSSSNSGDGFQATATHFYSPSAIAVDAAGNIYFANASGSQTIRKISTSGIVSTFAGTGVNGFSGDGGPATAAKFYNITGLAFDASGNLFLCDYDNHRVRKISTTGIITTVAGNGTMGYSGEGLVATASAIQTPRQIAIDGNGDIYFTEQWNHRVRKLSTSGILTTVAGNGNCCLIADTGMATAGTCHAPSGVALDGNGNLFVATDNSSCVRKVNLSTGRISTVAGYTGTSGTSGYSGDGGPATSSLLFKPVGLLVDNNGDLLIADNGNYRIRKVSCAQTVSAVSGASSLCTGTTTSLACTTVGGTWTSGSPTVASVNAAGMVTGITSGTAIISYSITNACNTKTVTKTVTVNGLPVVAAIGGASSVCTGANITLTDATTGGVWSSSTPTIASVSATGVVRGNTAGTATISYSVTGTCGTRVVTKAVSVSGLPTVAAIGGASSVCASAATTLTDATTGGVWSSSAATVATVNAAGVVSGLSAGTATITYSVTNTCGTTPATKAVTVNGAPIVANIAGSSAVCIGANITLTDATTGGVWNSSDPSIASVSATGVVRGNIAGSTNINYAVSNSCGTTFMFKAITVNAATAVATISGASSVCTGAATTFTNTTAGGVWSSSAASVASVNAVGVVNGLTAGAAIISYSFTDVCGTAVNTKAVTVSAPPTVANIAGLSDVCVGANITLTDVTTGGVWSSLDPTIASVSATGVVRGVAAGSTTIYYTVTNTCGLMAAVKIVAVSAAPAVAAISGASSVCTGTNITLTDATTGGVWSSSTPTIASVSATGVVRGNTAGTATISYAVTGTCGTNRSIKSVTVGTGTVTVAAVSGVSTMCAGSVATFTDATAGGTWTSSATGIATVSATGVVSGVATGDAVISYTVPNTCGTGSTSAVTSVHVSPLATISAITGTSSIVPGSSTSLVCTGLAWNSANTAVATVNAVTGVVTGVATGTATISCSSSNACGTVYATFVMTVAAAPIATIYSISTFAGTGLSGFSGDGGTATAAQMSYPYAVAVTSAGIKYIADQVNNRIRKVTAAGVISTIAGNGSVGNTGDGGAATAATFSNPTGVAVDAAGNVYVADYGNNRIRKISTTGIISNYAGSGIGLDGGAATAADVYHPSGVAVDASGNVYIAETGNNRVRKVTTSGIISTIAGNGVVGYSGDGGAGTAAKLSSPVGVSTDASGNVYIADLGNHRIRKVTAGIISTVAGTGVAGFSGDGGLATAAAINTPYGMSVDASGNIFICDYNNFRVRKVNTAGIMSTIAGTGAGSYSGDGGLATAAELNRPTGIAVDASGNIYIADVNNQRVRKLAPCTMPVSGTISGPSTVIIGNNITLATTGTGGTWSSVFTARATVSASGMVHAITSGVDTIKYTVTNTCGTARSTYVVNITAFKPGENAITESNAPASLNVYPNPSNGMLNLETAQGSGITTVLVFDISGKMVQQVNGNGNTLQLNISDYTPGVYILRVMQEDGSISQVRIVKE